MKGGMFKYFHNYFTLLNIIMQDCKYLFLMMFFYRKYISLLLQFLNVIIGRLQNGHKTG